MPEVNHRPSNSNWGDFGPDDQLGRLNLIGPDQVRKGIAEVVTGKTFCLSLPLDFPGDNTISPVRFPPVIKPVVREGGPYYNFEWQKTGEGIRDVASDDYVTLYSQYSTQWDSLAHRGAIFDADGHGKAEAFYYNGHLAKESLKLNQDGTVKACALGIENMATHGVQGRAVLVDFFSSFGTRHQRVGYTQLMDILKTQNVVVEAGDIFCFWSGLDRLILDAKGSPDPSLKQACAVLDGHDSRLLDWISDSGVAAIASDTIAIEAIGINSPKRPGDCLLPLHDHCLYRLGIHLGELWYLAELAQWLKENRRSRFLLTAPPLRLPGAVGSPVTPIATV